MTGTVVETLLPAIEQLTEAVRAVDSSVATSFWDIWGPSFLTFVGTLIFACIALRSLKAAKEANELAVHLNFKNRLLDNFQSISYYLSEAKTMLVESEGRQENLDKFETTLSLIGTKLTEGYYFFVFFTVSYKYIHLYLLLVLQSIKEDPNWLEFTQNEEKELTQQEEEKMFFRPPRFIKRIGQIFAEIALFSQKQINTRKKLEIQSFNSFSESNCKHLSYKEQFDLLAEAMENLRNFKPYDFNQKTKPPSSTP